MPILPPPWRELSPWGSAQDGHKQQTAALCPYKCSETIRLAPLSSTVLKQRGCKLQQSLASIPFLAPLLLRAASCPETPCWSACCSTFACLSSQRLDRAQQPSLLKTETGWTPVSQRVLFCTLAAGQMLHLGATVWMRISQACISAWCLGKAA